MLLTIVLGWGNCGTMLDIFQWLGINALLPLAPIAFFYLGTLLIKGAANFQWIPPIHDGQICFYSTTISMIAIRDIFAVRPATGSWFFGLAACWLLSFFRLFHVRLFDHISE